MNSKMIFVNSISALTIVLLTAFKDAEAGLAVEKLRNQNSPESDSRSAESGEYIPASSSSSSSNSASANSGSTSVNGRIVNMFDPSPKQVAELVRRLQTEHHSPTDGKIYNIYMSKGNHSPELERMPKNYRSPNGDILNVFAAPSSKRASEVAPPVSGSASSQDVQKAVATVQTTAPSTSKPLMNLPAAAPPANPSVIAPNNAVAPYSGAPAAVVPAVAGAGAGVPAVVQVTPQYVVLATTAAPAPVNHVEVMPMPMYNPWWYSPFSFFSWPLFSPFSSFFHHETVVHHETAAPSTPCPTCAGGAGARPAGPSPSAGTATGGAAAAASSGSGSSATGTGGAPKGEHSEPHVNSPMSEKGADARVDSIRKQAEKEASMGAKTAAASKSGGFWSRLWGGGSRGGGGFGGSGGGEGGSSSSSNNGGGGGRRGFASFFGSGRSLGGGGGWGGGRMRFGGGGFRMGRFG